MNKLGSDLNQKGLILLRLYLLFVTLTGIVTAWGLIRIPVDANNTGFLGYSQERMLLTVGVIFIIFVAFFFLLSSWVCKSLFFALRKKISEITKKKKSYGWTIILLALGLLVGSFILLISPEIPEPFTKTFLERIFPLVIWFTILCGLTLLALSLLHYDFNFFQLKPKSRIAYFTAIIFGFLLILWLTISLTGLGVIATDAGAGWNPLGSPVTEIQVFLSWMVGIIYIFLVLLWENRIQGENSCPKIRYLRIDLVISILIWLVAFLIWNGMPLLENWFVTPPLPPNHEFYPSSDASIYDSIGQSLLVGVGYKYNNSPFAIRPLYALFLSVLHSIGGLGYEPIIWMQVAVLALIPVLLYWITRQLHTRVSALIAAFLYIFREANAIALGDSITTSHVKLLMSDLPTTLGVMIFTLLIIRWLQKPNQRLILTLIAGGVAGAFMLIRPEFGVLIPFIGGIAFLQLVRNLGIWFKGMVFIVIGVILMLSPWIWRNYQITGTIFLDSPHYRADLLAKRYSDADSELLVTTGTSGDIVSNIDSSERETVPTNQPTEPPEIVILPGERRNEFTKRMVDYVSTFAKNNPGQVLKFVSNHFLNSQVQTVLFLPNTFRLPDSFIGLIGHRDLSIFWKECCSVDQYIRRLPFWFKWDGHLPRQSVIPLFLNLFFISVGIGSVWKNNKFLGLIPLGAHLGYTLINALVRNSGGRYIIPVSWIGILYFAIGLGQFSIWIIRYFRGGDLNSSIIGELTIKTPSEDARNSSILKVSNLGVAICIFLSGIILPTSERIIPPRYSMDTEDIQGKILALPVDFQTMVTSLVESGGDVFPGRALYPKYYPADYDTHDSDLSKIPTNSYITFNMVGPYNNTIILLHDNVPKSFPNGTDVIIIGCREKKHFDALAVVIFDVQHRPIEIIQRTPMPNIISCPIQSP
jgi:hypothetical protein